MLIAGLESCMFLSAVWTHSDGTHSLQRIHWWTSDAMLSKSVPMKKQNHFQQIFLFRVNHSLNERLPLCIGADSPFISLLTGAFLNVYNAYVVHSTHSYSVISRVLFSFIGQFITHLHVWMNLIIAVVVLQTDLIWEHFKTVSFIREGRM